MVEDSKYRSIDLEGALKLLGGYRQIYEKVAKEFLKNQINLVSEVKGMLNNDLDEARRLVHSCKGISKNLGANKLHDITTELEIAIIDRHKALIKQYMKEFEAEFKVVIKELHKLVSE